MVKQREEERKNTIIIFREKEYQYEEKETSIRQIINWKIFVQIFFHDPSIFSTVVPNLSLSLSVSLRRERKVCILVKVSESSTTTNSRREQIHNHNRPSESESKS